MKHCKKRIAKIVDELLTYFLKLRATNVTIHLEELESSYVISIEGNCKNLTEDMVQKIDCLLNTPLHEEFEEFYWELMGEGDVDNELALVGMMTAKAEINYVLNESLNIKLYRNK